MKIVYNPTLKGSFVLWICTECGSEFYGGGPALHEPVCSQKNYAKCEAHIGPEFVKHAKDMSNKFGDNFPWDGITLKMLREAGIA